METLPSCTLAVTHVFFFCEGSDQPLTGAPSAVHLAKEPYRGSARAADEYLYTCSWKSHLFCISLFLFHTANEKRYEGFPTATSVSSASKAKGNFISIRNPTQMKQALSFLLSVLVIFPFKEYRKKACSLLENIDVLKKTATHVE